MIESLKRTPPHRRVSGSDSFFRNAQKLFSRSKIKLLRVRQYYANGYNVYCILFHLFL